MIKSSSQKSIRNQTKNKITKNQTTLTDNHLDITCRTDEVTDGRKKNSFKVMKASRPRPLSAYEVRSTSKNLLENSGGEKQNNVKMFKDRRGRPAADMELLSNPYKQTSWYKMTKRPKTAPVPKAKPPPPPPLLDKENTSPSSSPITVRVKVRRRSSTNAQLNSIEAKLDKKMTMLYGEKKRMGSEQEDKVFITRSDSRRGSMKTAKQVDDDTMSDISDYEDQRALDIAKLKHRRATFKQDNNAFNQIRAKFQNFEEKIYPSKLMNPNPSSAGRDCPFPCILDPDRYNEFCKNVSQVKTTAIMIKDLHELYAHYKVRRRVPVYAWDGISSPDNDPDWDV